MPGIENIPRSIQELAKNLPQVLTESMRDGLLLVGQIAATKYMIQTSANSESGLPHVTAAVDPERLTWRTGALARSLVRRDDPDNITEIVREGSAIRGTIGTRKEYAAIHEFGGTVPAHQLEITERMRSYMWAMFYETGEEKYKWMALKRSSDVFTISERLQHARPFLTPAGTDPEVQQDLRTTLSVRMHELIIESFAGVKE